MTPEYRIKIEKQITAYLKKYDVEKIKYMQVEQTFQDMGIKVNVWNVKAEDSSWWIVEGENTPMNLYTQEAFYFSADEAYSFHMGITQRLQAKHHENYRHVIDELPLDLDRVKSISRRLNKISMDLNNVSGPEDIQSIALTCRESLIELAKIIAKENPTLLKDNDLKAADFKGVTKAIAGIYGHNRVDASMTAKEKIKEIIGVQPEDAAYEEGVRELAFTGMFDRGLKSARQGRVISKEEMGKRIRLWQK